MPEGSWSARFKAAIAAAKHPAFSISIAQPKAPLAPIVRPKDNASGTNDINGAAEENDVQPPVKAPDQRKIQRRAKAGPLQGAVAAAVKLGAAFQVVGANIDIEGSLSDELRTTLSTAQLYPYLVPEDQAAVDFLARLNVTPILVTSATAADLAMSALDGSDIIALDFETGPREARPKPLRITRTGTVAKNQPTSGGIGLDPHRSVIQTAQLYAGGAHAYVFHGAGLEHLLSSAWFARQRYVAHTAEFEDKFARHRGIELQLECTRQAAGLLYGVENHNRKGHSRKLAYSAKLVLGLEPPKDLQNSCWSAPQLSPGQISYAAADVILTFRLWQKMQLQLRRQRLWAYELQRDAVPPVADMELRGLGYRPVRHAQLISEWQNDVAALEAKIIEVAGKPAPTKRDETQKWVKSVAGDLLSTWPLTKKGFLSTTAADYARLENVPAAQLILELRARKTLLSTFGKKILNAVNPVTGRIHGSYNISRTKTGRFSCSEPNLQNQPSRKKESAYKSIFTAEAGRTMVAGDLKQVELRAMAYVSGCPDMTAVFEAGGDLHAETALAMTDKKREELSDEEFALLRDHAKAVNFSVIFGSGGEGLAKTAWESYGVKITAKEGDAAIAQFFAKYPRVKQWMWESWVESTRHSEIRIGIGRVVKARWETNHEITKRQAANLPIQGICPDLMLRALRLVFERLRAAEIDGGLVASVHDELLLEVAEADADKACRILEEAMTEAFTRTFPGAPMTGGVVDIKIGPSWGELQAPKEWR